MNNFAKQIIDALKSGMFGEYRNRLNTNTLANAKFIYKSDSRAGVIKEQWFVIREQKCRFTCIAITALISN